MVYIPKKPQSINAYKFKGQIDYEGERLGLTPVPSMYKGRCQCGKSMSDHAVIGNNIICPNTYILYEGDTVTNLMSASNFESIYKPLFDIDDCLEVKCEVVNEKKCN